VIYDIVSDKKPDSKQIHFYYYLQLQFIIAQQRWIIREYKMMTIIIILYEALFILKRNFEKTSSDL